MPLVCPHCSRTLEFSGEAPRFCAYCGQSLSTEHFAATAHYEPKPTDETLAAGAERGSAASVAVPDVIGDYRLIRTLGGGGMGTVYEAEQTTTGRRVALKLIAPQFASSRDAVERFRQEGRLASAIAHPRCVFVVAADEEAGRPYIVMELMPGQTLEDLVQREGPLPAQKAVAKILDVIEGLQEAHRLGVIHRDVKPSNCFVDKDGRVKIGDFGLSKSLESDQSLTRSGAFLGTVLYGSPEQLRREELDEQTDIYSLAATLYYVLTGRAPYQSGDAMATIAQIFSEPPTPPRKLRPDLPPELERVLLKGLERQRERRYKNLAEFRAALLPFFQRRLAIGSLGWRFLAYLVDFFVIFIVVQAVEMSAFVARGYDLGDALDPQKAQLMMADPIMEALPYFGAALWITYFFLGEALFGCCLGKRLLRLRVMSARSDRLAGWLQVGARTFVAYFLIHFGTVLTFAAVQSGVLEFKFTPGQQLQQEFATIREAIWLGGLFYGGLFAGLAVLLCTMRPRNGHRGLHELLSGTRVVRLPQTRRERLLWRSSPQDEKTSVLQQVAGTPERVGSYTVQGTLSRCGAECILAAEDQTLGRRVWLWVRPAGAGLLSTARQNVSRTTRLRWLDAGELEGQQWDAFVAPAGCTLSALVTQRGRLSWAETRPILEQLSFELSMATEEWTLPARFRTDQVWVQPSNRVVLLDAPCFGMEENRVGSPEAPEEGPQEERALRLLGDVASLALEGRPRQSLAPATVRAPIPGHATALLERLCSQAEAGFKHVKDFRQELEAGFDQPEEISRPRRLTQLFFLAAFCSYWLFCCIPSFGLYSTPPFFWVFGNEAAQVGLHIIEEDFEEGRTLELVAALIQPNGFAQLSGIAVYDADQRLAAQLHDSLKPIEQQQAEILAECSAAQRALIGAWGEMLEQQEAPIRNMRTEMRKAEGGVWDFREMARNAVKNPPNTLRPFDLNFVFIPMLLLCIPPALFVLWSFVIRGGLSYRLAGIALVRHDGRPAWRLQCLLRAFLVWIPVAGLLVFSMYLEGEFWAGWSDLTWRREWRWLLTAAMVSWWTGPCLLVLNAALALAFPRRSVHDWLAGTYLVPR